jgi:hypothetical protein
MFYLNKNRDLIINSSIVEYDIRSGNTSMMRHYDLTDISTIEKIEKMEKGDRVRKVGLLMKEDKEFAKNLEKSFDLTVREFLSLNNLDIDYDVISIKRDAVFVINQDIKNPRIGDHIEFVPKNQYAHYLYIKPLDSHRKFLPLKPHEFYIRRDFSIDNKGLSDDLLDKHQEGMLDLIRNVIKITSIDPSDNKMLYKFLKEYVDLYKKKELEFSKYLCYVKMQIRLIGV